jgi:hypothetical protein
LTNGNFTPRMKSLMNDDFTSRMKNLIDESFVLYCIQSFINERICTYNTFRYPVVFQVYMSLVAFSLYSTPQYPYLRGWSSY